MNQYYVRPCFNYGQHKETLKSYPPNCYTYFNCPFYREYIEGNNKSSPASNMTKLELSNTFRELWEQHGIWTRMTIMSIIFNLPDVDLVTTRLLKNPEDFGNTLKIFYGSENASKFTNLLKDHLVIAAQLVKAAKAGNNNTAADAEKKWYANADTIASLLASINPYWSEEEWKSMLHEHLRLVKAEAVSMLTKDYGAGIKVFDDIEKQALEMADTLTEGVLNQFSDSFIE